MSASSESIRVLTRSWSKDLADLVGGAQSSLVICSPFVSVPGTDLVRSNLSDRFRDGRAELVFATNLSIRNMIQAVTDPLAILSVAETASRSRIIHLPGLHAKAYIADQDRAIVTSGNLTAGGLYDNFECGVLLQGRDVVEAVHAQLCSYMSLGAEVPSVRLAAFGQVMDEVCTALRSSQQSAQRETIRQFKTSLSFVEDELLRLRLSQGPVHSVFAKTIEFLLRTKGEMTTLQLHPEIASLHPDLCDDSVDRVIDGKRFGKKWKHAVRTAQQQLKRREIIEYVGEIWRIKE